MNFFIKEENIRNGNRGGRNLFNWNDVRLMNNRDRESYLGASQIIGYLDKGGKWCKSDWWINYKNTNNLSNCIKNKDTLLDEQKEIRKQEKEKLYEAIYGKKKKNNVINELKEEKEDNKEYELLRPGLGMNKINKENGENGKKEEKIKTENEKTLLGKKTKHKYEDDNENYQKDKLNFSECKNDNNKKDKKHRHHHHHSRKEKRHHSHRKYS